MQTQDHPLVKAITTNLLFLFLGIVASILAFIQPLIAAINNHDIASAGLLVTAVALALIAVFLLRRYYLPKSTPVIRQVFKPFEPLDVSNAWPRTMDSNRLITIIKSTKGKPIILVGDTGVGKSVLINTLVTPRLKADCWHILPINRYIDFENEIRTWIARSFPEWLLGTDGTLKIVKSNFTNLLIIFDQFEQFLSAEPKNSRDYEKSKTWLRRFLASVLKEQKIRVAIVVRKELYYDLRFLEEYIVPPAKCRHLDGLLINEEYGGLSALRSKLREVSSGTDVVETILDTLRIDDEVLPVEAQIVGCMVENKGAGFGGLTNSRFKEMGSKYEIIKDFLGLCLDSSPRFRDTSLQILFALSMETTFRKTLTLSDIVSITHKPEQEIQDCLNSLMGLHLVQSFAGKFQLTHDYLAERFHELSGSELDPIERDNIIFFGDELRKGHLTTQVKCVKFRPGAFRIISDYFMAFLFLLIFTRLVAPTYGYRWDLLNPYAYIQTSNTWFDIYYLPIFLSHLCWSAYVTIFYRRFFSFLKEGMWGKILSILTQITCALSVICAVFIPYCWVLSIGFGGIWIGIKLIQLSYSHSLRPVSKKEFAKIGWVTFGNAVIASVIGFVFAVSFLTTQPTQELNIEYLRYSTFILLIMLYTVYYVSTRHITKKATAKMLGMFDRRSRSTIKSQ